MNACGSLPTRATISGSSSSTCAARGNRRFNGVVLPLWRVPVSSVAGNARLASIRDFPSVAPCGPSGPVPVQNSATEPPPFTNRSNISSSCGGRIARERVRSPISMICFASCVSFGQVERRLPLTQWPRVSSARLRSAFSNGQSDGSSVSNTYEIGTNGKRHSLRRRVRARRITLVFPNSLASPLRVVPDRINTCCDPAPRSTLR
jgi:hypothetical protein